MATPLFTSLIALSILQHALAETSNYTPVRMTTAPSPTSITPINTAQWVSGQAEAKSSRASVSSLLGPFYETVMFMPGVERGDWVSAIASGGENDETTTWAGYWQDYYTDPADRFAVVNMTIGPTTYIETGVMPLMTLSVSDVSTGISTLLGWEATTSCSHTSIAPKISVPDSEWQAGLWNPQTMADDHYFTYSAVCTGEGHTTMESGISSLPITTWTIDKDRDTYWYEPGWKLVTVAGESPTAVVADITTGGVAAQTGGGSGAEGVKATSTQAAGASEVTAWVNAVAVMVAAVAMAI